MGSHPETLLAEEAHRTEQGTQGEASASVQLMGLALTAVPPATLPLRCRPKPRMGICKSSEANLYKVYLFMEP